MLLGTKAWRSVLLAAHCDCLGWVEGGWHLGRVVSWLFICTPLLGLAYSNKDMLLL